MPGRRVGLREDDVDRSDARVRDEPLAAVEDVLVAVAARGRPHRRAVGARARLGQRVRREPLARRELRQEPLLLLVGARELDPERAELLRRRGSARSSRRPSRAPRSSRASSARSRRCRRTPRRTSSRRGRSRGRARRRPTGTRRSCRSRPRAARSARARAPARARGSRAARRSADRERSSGAESARPDALTVDSSDVILENGLDPHARPAGPDAARARDRRASAIAGGVGVHETALASPEVGRPRRPRRRARLHRLARPLPHLGARADARSTSTAARRSTRRSTRIARRRGRPAGRWLRGYGWRSGDWRRRREPTRADLDAVTGDVPAALIAKDYHSLWLNSAALALAGGDLEVAGGVVERDAHGEPTGVLREEAAWRFKDALPDRPRRRVRRGDARRA